MLTKISVDCKVVIKRFKDTETSKKPKTSKKRKVPFAAVEEAAEEDADADDEDE